MRSVLLAGLLLLGGHDALAQQLPAPEISLRLSVEQTKLIVQTLGAIGCPNVTQLMVCEQARDLLREIQRQAKEQVR